MSSSVNSKTTGVAIILIVIVGISGLALAPYFGPQPSADTVTIHLLLTEGLMIEYNNSRLFIDPWYLLDNYTDFLADVILITHPHFDHYNESVVSMLQKETTVNVLPSNMSDEVTLHDGIGVVPGDVIQIGDFTITAFYQYSPGHPREANWTSYLVDINGFTIFHAGDSMNITEYNQLNGLVDAAFLPVYNYDISTVYSIEMIQPNYYIPIHFAEGYNDIYINAYGDEIAAVSDCEILVMDYWTSHVFEI
jgi:L-ascorbate metabolism protein UlaG (beta-lactamase superfamily)